MSTLNQAALDAAYHAFWAHPGDSRPSVEAAIRTYMAEAFKPGAGELIVGEAIQPQRDYRKELWIEAWKTNGSSLTANTALQQFDTTFGDSK